MQPYHYLGSAKTFCAIGKAFGEGHDRTVPLRRQELKKFSRFVRSATAAKERTSR